MNNIFINHIHSANSYSTFLAAILDKGQSVRQWPTLPKVKHGVLVVRKKQFISAYINRLVREMG